MKNMRLLFPLIGIYLINVIEGNVNVEEIHKIQRRQACSDTRMCRSKWGFCGTGTEYCGDGCTAGPCSSNGNNGSGNGDIISDQIFACAFNSIDAGTRANRLDGLRKSGWKPTNKEEAAVFLSHVFHETGGLKIISESCAPGCSPNYAGSWCNVQGKRGKLYHGRGWFHLSWPCNYYAAGQALGVDLLSDPDLVAQRQDLAVKTAIWFYQTHYMANPARRGDFAATTKIINGQLECNGGPGANNQKQRVLTYRRIRNCFALGDPAKNPTC